MIKKDYLNSLVFLKGAVRYSDLCYVIAQDKEAMKTNTEHTILLELDRRTWKSGFINFSLISCAPAFAPEHKIISIDNKGLVSQMGGGEINDNLKIPPAPDETRPFFFQNIACINNGKAYAVGPSRICYRRDDTDRWTRIDHTAQTDDMDPMNSGFKTIDGFSDEDIYAAGWGGELWHYDGERWQRIDIPTNIAFHKLVCAANGKVYLCGQMGVIAMGRGSQWKIIKHEPREEFWGMTYFNDTLYIASRARLYQLNADEDALLPVDFGMDVPPTTFYDLDARDGILWSVGEKDVVEFNGSQWKQQLKVEA